MINPAWGGSLPLHDHSSGTNAQVAAVLIAPGVGLSGQVRTPGTPCNGGANDPANFLESLDGFDNASGSAAVRAPAQAGFNDVVLPILARDLINAVAPRVLLELGGSSDSSGLRKLLLTVPTPDPAPVPNDPAPPAWAWYIDSGGHPVLNFLDPRVIDAFPAGASGASKTTGNCTEYLSSGQTRDTVAIEWLCFNSWTQFTQFKPTDPSQIVLTLPSLGWQAVWQASVVPSTRTQLHRVPNT
jgi:hypothetical protein